MATITRTYTETFYTTNKATWTVSITGVDQTVSRSFDMTMPIVKAKYVCSGKTQGYIHTYFQFYREDGRWIGEATFDKPDATATLVSMTSGTTYTIPNRSFNGMTDLYLWSYFNSSNKTSRTTTITAKLGHIDGASDGNDKYNDFYDDTTVDLGAIATITLDVPPTATVSTLSVDTAPYAYAGVSTASVTVSDATAYYGGDIDSITMTIGEQTVGIVGDTIEVPLNASGTFTPVVTVTDSRGQIQEYSLDPITVGIYSTPTVNFDAERTDINGKVADEGAYATIPTTLTFDLIAQAVAPSVSVTDEDGNAQTIDSIIWYSSRANDGTLSGAVTWSTLPSGSTIYGLISITDDFSTVLSYNISVTPIDNKNITGLTITDTLQTAFYTVDFLAGGHGIAFGQPCAQEGFFCNMDAYFIDYSKVMHSIFDIFYPKGSYYETHLPYTINGHSYDDDNLTNSEIALCGETWFDPRIAWGGTWVLETEGQVHVSAGTNYTVAGALTNDTDGGSPYIQAHTHGFTQPKIPNHQHSMNNIWSDGSGSSSAYTMSSSRKLQTRKTANDGGGGACTGGTVNGVQDSSHNTMATGDAGNMPPYIVVYRWHRTA